jgi:hypothetical protein
MTLFFEDIINYNKVNKEGKLIIPPINFFINLYNLILISFNFLHFIKKTNLKLYIFHNFKIH